MVGQDTHACTLPPVVIDLTALDPHACSFYVNTHALTHGSDLDMIRIILVLGMGPVEMHVYERTRSYINMCCCDAVVFSFTVFGRLELKAGAGVVREKNTIN